MTDNANKPEKKSKGFKLKQGYVSEATHLLQKLEESAESESKTAEVRKYERVHELRDNPDAEQPKSKIWEGF